MLMARQDDEGDEVMMRGIMSQNVLKCGMNSLNSVYVSWFYIIKE